MSAVLRLLGDEDARQCVEDAIGRVMNTGVPVGWNWSAKCVDNPKCSDWAEIVGDRWNRIWAADTGVQVSKTLGWLLAAFAMALGAPFWFDLLRRVTGIRKKTTRDT